MNSNKPLSGIRVVGLEHSVAGPLCTRILADLGADVIKVERPNEGDFARHWDRNAGGESAQFLWLNRGKRSITLDIKQQDDLATFEALLDSADAFVHNLSPAAAARLGFGRGEFEDRFPRLVQIQISGYGSTGALRDRKAYDMLIQAEAGIMGLTGNAETPSRVGVSICDVGTGIYAAALALGAIFGQRESGRGRFLDVAMIDTAMEFLGPMLLSYVNAGVTYPRIPQRHHAIAPYGAFECGDGKLVLLAVEQDQEWRLVCDRLLAAPELAEDPRFVDNAARIANREAIDEIVAGWLAQRSRAEAIADFDSLGLAYGALNDVAGVSTHPTIAERGILRSTDTRGGDQVTSMVGIGARLFGADADSEQRPPALGEHSDEIRAELAP